MLPAYKRVVQNTKKLLSFFIQSIDIANILQYKMYTFWKQWEWFTGPYFQTHINHNKLTTGTDCQKEWNCLHNNLSQYLKNKTTV